MIYHRPASDAATSSEVALVLSIPKALFVPPASQAVWFGMGSPVSLNRAEVRAIAEKSAVDDEPYAWKQEDGCVKLEAALGCSCV